MTPVPALYELGVLVGGPCDGEDFALPSDVSVDVPTPEMGRATYAVARYNLPGDSPVGILFLAHAELDPPQAIGRMLELLVKRADLNLAPRQEMRQGGLL